MDLATLYAAVDEAFALTGRETPGWPDPHDGRDPADEEYSRCLEPGKYGILAARARAWVQALVAAGMADLDPPEAVPWVNADEVTHGGCVERFCLRPRADGAIPLVVECRRSADDGLVCVEVGAGNPALVVGSHPFCGCDACDHGSDRCLDDLDRTVLDVVTGGLVRVQTPAFTATRSLHGWSSSGDLREATEEYVATLFEDVVAGRSPYPSVYGRSWLDGGAQ